MAFPAERATLSPRQHIQNFSDPEAIFEPHWGYAERVLPCKNDQGSCEYLDEVYGAHDVGMLYTGIFWGSALALLLVWGIIRRSFPPRNDLIITPKEQQPPKQSTLTRLRHSVASATRRHLLPHAPVSLFGHTTRLQVATLAILIGYLTILSFAGITYKIWRTPIAGQPPTVRNTRSSLGPWADRVGVLAYALTPLSVLLASRENLLSHITGVPYTSFLFLHRWTGYIILIQSLLHTLGWVLIEAHLYQPQPSVWLKFSSQLYAVWGFVALGLLVLLWALSLRWTIRRVTGYEVFRKVHYVLAAVYMGACIGHWDALSCFLVPGLVLWAVDRLARGVRTALLHYHYIEDEGTWAFRSAAASAKVWRDARNGDVVRLDLTRRQTPWTVGQHFYLTFVDSSIWQSHPFTPLNVPVADATGEVTHSYLMRAKGGETKKVAEMLVAKMDAKEALTTRVILNGPYGGGIVAGLTADVNVLCVAGGTGITYVLPVLLGVVRRAPRAGKVELVWAVKRAEDVEWVAQEMEELRRLGARHGVVVRVFVTDGAVGAAPALGEKEVQVDTKRRSSSASGSDAEGGRAVGRPDLAGVVAGFVEGVARGSTRVYGSGPPGMIGDLRAAVARSNDAGKVWRGEERFDVSLICDDRLEW
ncbi:putative ferric reductase transmembrane component [Podospora conica]|nr:putative ferric reductase transmembrane component [Schizothecium conicum]